MVFNPLVNKGFDKVGISLADLPPELGALAVADTDTVNLTLTGNTLTANALNTYTLPTASTSTLGGIKIGSRLTITDGVLSADVQTTDISGKEDVGVAAGLMTTHEGTYSHALIATALQEETDPVWTSEKGSYPTKAQADLLYAPISITQYTDELAQDAVGGILTNTGNVQFTYDDATPKITATVDLSGKQDANAVLTELTALTDPAANRVVVWNDTSNNFEFLSYANWDTAYGWGNHASAGYVTGTPWTAMGYYIGDGSAFATSGHNHDLAYLGISAKASDSDLLDGHDTAYFQTALGYTAENTANKGQANGYAPLGADSKIASTYLPPIAMTDVAVVASEAAQLALTAEEGDVAVRSDLNKSYIHNGGSAGTIADWTELLTPTDTVLSVNGQTGVVSLQLAQTEAGAANNFLTAYNATTGAFSKAQPTWANIDKTTSSIADITTRSHTALTDIGTNTHAQIDTFIGTTVPATYAPLVSPSFTTPVLGVATGTSLDLSGHSATGNTAVIATGIVQSVKETLTVTTAGGSAVLADLTISPSAPLTGTVYGQGNFGVARWDSDENGTGTYYAELRGILGTASSSGTASGDLRNAIGGYFAVQHLGSGTLNNAWGVRGWVDNNAATNATGNITNAYNFYSECSTNKGTGVITNRYGMYILDKTGVGAVTNQYGLYIENIDGGTNNYSIYSAGGANYFGGALTLANGATLAGTGSIREQINFVNSTNAIPDFTGTLGSIVGSTSSGFVGPSGLGSGGMNIAGFTEATATLFPMVITGYHGSTAPTAPAVMLRAGKHNGATAAVALAAGETVLSVRNWTTDLVTVKGNGDAYFVADVSALTFTDRTPYFEGDALAEIKNIKGKNGEIDHATLPEFARRKLKNDNDEEIDGRDLGAMISILVKSNQQLLERIEQLEKK